MNERLTIARRNKGWSQQDLANAAGVHQTMVSMVEKGSRTPSPQIAKKLADALGVKISDIFTVKTVEIIVTPEVACVPA